MMEDYNYIKALWSHFYGPKPKDPVSDELHHHISVQLDTDLRKQLLKLVDCQSAHTELVSLESFAAGFRLAIRIATELTWECTLLRKRKIAGPGNEKTDIGTQNLRLYQR